MHPSTCTHQPVDLIARSHRSHPSLRQRLTISVAQTQGPGIIGTPYMYRYASASVRMAPWMIEPHDGGPQTTAFGRVVELQAYTCTKVCFGVLSNIFANIFMLYYLIRSRR